MPAEQLPSDPKLTVLKHEDVWIVSDRYGHWTRIEGTRASAEDVRESMAAMYRQGREAAFAELRKLIGAKA